MSIVLSQKPVFIFIKKLKKKKQNKHDKYDLSPSLFFGEEREDSNKKEIQVNEKENNNNNNHTFIFRYMFSNFKL